MAENDNKRYYWLKLKKDFFQQHQIKVLKSMPNGRLYALIYLELLAESTSHNGELRYSKLLPYDTITLASVIDEDKDNLENAIKILSDLELVEVLTDGTIFMQEIVKLIGSETGQTIRKRVAKIESGNFQVDFTQEYRDKSKENRVKSKEYINNNNNNTFIPPTYEEVNKYCQENNLDLDIQGYLDYYEKHNWKWWDKNLKQYMPVESWKRCVRTFIKNKPRFELNQKSKEAYIKDVAMREQKNAPKQTVFGMMGEMIKEGMDDRGNLIQNKSDNK